MASSLQHPSLTEVRLHPPVTSEISAGSPSTIRRGDDSLRLNEEFVVIGGGPVGMSMAIGLRLAGRSVAVLERGYSEEASFNFTLVKRSIDLLGGLGVDMLPSCAPIWARQVWSPDGTSSVHPYGTRETDRLYSVPRRELLRHQQVALESLGVETRQGWSVIRLDARRGRALVETPEGVLTIAADKFVVADGANSRSREDIARQADVDCDRHPDGFVYAVTRIEAAEARAAGLGTDRIHFAPGKGCVDIGIGNADGSVSLLLERRASEIASVEDECAVLRVFMSGAPPTLRRHLRNPEDQILASPKRAFKYASCGVHAYCRAILVGDAARCWPPYLGQGLNAGLQDVGAFLAAFQNTGGEWGATLRRYESDRTAHAERLSRLAHHHGNMLLTGEFGSWRWRLRDRVERVAERWLGYRNFYQRLVFDMSMPPVAGWAG